MKYNEKVANWIVLAVLLIMLVICINLRPANAQTYTNADVLAMNDTKVAGVFNNHDVMYENSKSGWDNDKALRAEGFVSYSTVKFDTPSSDVNSDTPQFVKTKDPAFNELVQYKYNQGVLLNQLLSVLVEQRNQLMQMQSQNAQSTGQGWYINTDEPTVHETRHKSGLKNGDIVDTPYGKKRVKFSPGSSRPQYVSI